MRATSLLLLLLASLGLLAWSELPSQAVYRLLSADFLILDIPLCSAWWTLSYSSHQRWPWLLFSAAIELRVLAL
jgi:hypothetical protein